MFTKDKAVPLVSLDDAALLEAERYSRKTHARAIASVGGGAARVLLINPVAVFSIAKSGWKGHKAFWSHEDLVAELNRRGLQPLPKGADESMGLLVAGQLVGIAAGEAVGVLLADSLVTDTVSSAAAGAAHGVVGSSVVDKFVGDQVAKAAGDAVKNAAEEAATSKFEDAGTSALGPGNAVLRPGVKGPPSPQPRARSPVLGFMRKPNTGPATATDHLTGRWEGWGEEVVEMVAVDTAEEGGANGAVAAGQAAAKASKPAYAAYFPITHRILTKLMPPAPSNGQPAPTPVAGVRYRLKFDLVFDGLIVSGKGLVDGCAVSGSVNASGTFVRLEEISENIVVTYDGKVAGGAIAGNWTSTDGRKGTFRITHF
ncbi:hypothetical protein HK101_006932 [Irineochytrium annulatum]|nr:hypothetical protein HK101_006932 [Irineochytrium annulatum]